MVAPSPLPSHSSVIATDLNPDLLEGLSMDTQALNVLEKPQILELIASLPKLDVLVNGADFVHHRSILECGDQDWEFSFNLNARSMFWTMQAALLKMLEAGAGSIVNISSVASSGDCPTQPAKTWAKYDGSSKPTRCATSAIRRSPERRSALARCARKRALATRRVRFEGSPRLLIAFGRCFPS